MKPHLVIAVYNENIDSNIFDIFIYNKGSKNITNKNCKIIPLENIGRESHTYLYHIIENYDNLPNKIIFFQGHPHDHVSSDFIFQINNFHRSDTNFHNFTKYYLNIKHNISINKLEESGILQTNNRYIQYKNYHELNCPLVEVFKKIYGFIDINNIYIEFIPGANFGVNKANIINKSKNFYIKCIDILKTSNNLINPDEGHSFERLWKFIFTNKEHL